MESVAPHPDAGALELAQALTARRGLVGGLRMRDRVAETLRAVAITENCTLHEAFGRLDGRVEEAVKRREKVNAFWFEDRKWGPTPLCVVASAADRDTLSDRENEVERLKIAIHHLRELKPPSAILIPLIDELIEAYQAGIDGTERWEERVKDADRQLDQGVYESDFLREKFSREIFKDEIFKRLPKRDVPRAWSRRFREMHNIKAFQFPWITDDEKRNE